MLYVCGVLSCDLNILHLSVNPKNNFSWPRHNALNLETVYYTLTELFLILQNLSGAELKNKLFGHVWNHLIFITKYFENVISFLFASHLDLSLNFAVPYFL